MSPLLFMSASIIAPAASTLACVTVASEPSSMDASSDQAPLPPCVPVYEYMSLFVVSKQKSPSVSPTAEFGYPVDVLQAAPSTPAAPSFPTAPSLPSVPSAPAGPRTSPTSVQDVPSDTQRCPSIPVSVVR